MKLRDGGRTGPRNGPKNDEPALTLRRRGHSAESVAHRIRRGEMLPDVLFDQMFPEWVRARSRTYWTPLAVARRAAELLGGSPATRILDVGSGAGKFCLTAAMCSRSRFVGVEQRPHLVAIARDLAARFGLENAEFVCGTADQLDWRDYDAFYFFNPFGENIQSSSAVLDHTVELSEQRYHRDVALSLERLARARVGTRVATYHGVGASLPPTYRHVARETLGEDVLDVWEQADPARVQ